MDEQVLDQLTVGQRIAYWRNMVGMTQEEFGSAMGVSRNTQANYETDKRLPDFAYLAALKAKGYAIGWLMGDPYMAAEQKPLTPQEALLLGHYQKADKAGQATIEQVARMAAGAA